MSLRTSSPTEVLVLPVLVLILAMIGFQAGAALAKTLIPAIGPSGTVALRLGFATLMLWPVWRPWRLRVDARAARAIVIYGLSLGCMNLLFYCALARIPLGIAVALEFTGPLAVSLAASRRGRDFLWVALALGGILMLVPHGVLREPVDPAGMVYALGSGGSWALYIIYGRRAGASHGGQITAMGMLVGAVVIVPFGIAHAGSALLAPAVWPTALAVALLSSALPYSLEMYAMTRLPTRAFGVLMSLDPALAAVFGLAFLGERLSLVQWSAIALIVLASLGSAASSRNPD